MNPEAAYSSDNISFDPYYDSWYNAKYMWPRLATWVSATGVGYEAERECQ